MDMFKEYGMTKEEFLDAMQDVCNMVLSTASPREIERLLDAVDVASAIAKDNFEK